MHPRTSRGTRRLPRVLMAVVALVGVGSGSAHALTGYQAFAYSVFFYYGETYGFGGDSKDFDGQGTVRMCSYADGYSDRYYWAKYMKNNTLAPDTTLKDKQYRFTDGAKRTDTFTASSSNRYHTNAMWQDAPSAPDWVGGYVASRHPC